MNEPKSKIVDLNASLQRISDAMPGTFKVGGNVINANKIIAISGKYDGKGETSYDFDIKLKGGSDVQVKMNIGTLPEFERSLLEALESSKTKAGFASQIK